MSVIIVISIRNNNNDNNNPKALQPIEGQGQLLPKFVTILGWY